MPHRSGRLPDKPNSDVTALVLSGGGSKGDFELGAIRYLYEVQNIDPTLLVGTSVGALNVAKLAEGEVSPQSGLKGLMKIWLTLDQNSDMWNYEYWVSSSPMIREPLNNSFVNNFQDSEIFKKPANAEDSPPDVDPGVVVEGTLALLFGSVSGPLTILAMIPVISKLISELKWLKDVLGLSSSIANLDPIRNKVYGRNVPDLFNPSLIANWTAGGKKKLRIGMVSLDSGKMRFVTETGELLERDGVSKVLNKTNNPVSCGLSEAVIASCSIGAVFPPVNIGDEWYVDGGHRNNIPTDPVYDPALNIKTVYVVSASPIGLSPVDFGTINSYRTPKAVTTSKRNIFEIMARTWLSTLIDETAFNAIEPRSGWGSRKSIAIVPNISIHDLAYVDPGLIRINADYGWMCADDAIIKSDPSNPANSNAKNLSVLSDDITSLRTQIWFTEGVLLNVFRDLETFNTKKYQYLQNYLPLLVDHRKTLNDKIRTRLSLGGKVPPLAERWAQIGEAHSTGFGDLPIKDLQISDNPSSLTSSMTSTGAAVFYTLDSFGSVQTDPDTNVEIIDFNNPRRVVFSTFHQEPLLATDVIGWRTVGRCKLVEGTLLSCIQTVDGITALFAVDSDGNIVRAEMLPDELGFAGWMPVSNGKAKPGGWVTGVSHRPGSICIFVVGTDNRPYSSTRNTNDIEWSGWSALPTTKTFPLGAPLSAVSRNRDLIDVFGSDDGGNILQAALNPTNPLGLDWLSVNGGMTSPGGYIAAVSCNVDEIDLFVIGTDGNIYHSFSTPTTPWTQWTRRQHDSTFNLDGYISAVSPSPGTIDVVAIDMDGRVVATTFDTPSRSFNGFVQIGTKIFDAGGRVSLIAQINNQTSRASCFGPDGVLHASVNAHIPSSSWSDWTPLSSYAGSPVVIRPPPSTNLPFVGSMDLTANDFSPSSSTAPDLIKMRVYQDVISSGDVEFVLESGPGIDWYKEITITLGPLGPSAGAQVPLTTDNAKKIDRFPLKVSQLGGGTLTLKKLNFANPTPQSLMTMPIGNVKPGSRIVFTWVKDS